MSPSSLIENPAWCIIGKNHGGVVLCGHKTILIQNTIQGNKCAQTAKPNFNGNMSMMGIDSAGPEYQALL